MDVSEVVFYDCDKMYTSRTSVLSLSGGESVSPCEVMFQIAGMTTDGCV